MINHFPLKVHVQYTNRPRGEGYQPKRFSSMDAIYVDNNAGILVMYLADSDYRPDCFGAMSSLETEKEIIIAKRSNEVSSFKNKYTTVSGAPEFGTRDIGKWVENRIEEETNNKPYFAYPISISSDIEERCTILNYRGFVEKINELPSKHQSKYGVLKYSEMFILGKEELPDFVRKNKENIASSFRPILDHTMRNSII